MLDPHPANELGHGILDPVVEADMIAQGAIFALQVTEPDGHVSLAIFHSPVLETLTGMRDHGRDLLVAKRKEAWRRATQCVEPIIN